MAQEAPRKGTQANALVEAEAAIWAARLDSAGPAPDAELEEGLAHWLAAHPRHRGALLRAQALLHLAATASAEIATEPEPEWERAEPKSRRWWWAGLGLAAAVAAGLVAFLDLDGDSYVTDKGEMRQVALADGSALMLDAASKLAVDLDADERAVEMKRGRALFRVRHDAARPFRVVLGDVTITDVGTVFSVARREDEVMVIVSEGMVEVTAPGVHLRLGAGQQMRLGHGAPLVQPISPAAVERAMAWTSNRLDLDGETLASAVEALNSHNRVQIRLASPALGAERLYGAFRLDDPLGFARAAGISVNAPVREGDEQVVIGEK